ncbi:hypothetical protein C8R45DRAFT_1109849 [Mycena sanguinolenta]|nr:hypothetical protein C8R45DRAFT_1109849 [Mycena sanguinolenta]
MTDSTSAGPHPFDWGVPDPDVPVPATREAIPGVPVSLFDVNFNPIGAYDVRRNLGVKIPDFKRLRERFLDSNVAFLSSGASNDGRHFPSPDCFFPEYWQLYDSQPTGKAGQVARKQWGDRVRRMLFDITTKYDRSTAGTTLIVHVNGTTVPGMPLAPERLKADVYIPPHFLAEHPELHPTIAFVVQTVIERIGMATAEDWRRRAEKVWNLTHGTNVGPVVLPKALIPSPPSIRSAHYLFAGRRVGQLTLPAPTTGPIAPGLVNVNEEDAGIFDIEEPSYDIDRVEELKAENDELRISLDSMRTLNATMTADFKDREQMQNAELQYLASEVARLEMELCVAKVKLPPRELPAPSPQVPSTPARRTLPARAPTSPIRPAAEQIPLTTTSDELLGLLGLTSVQDAVILIMRFVSPINWRAELGRLKGLDGVAEDVVEELVNAMDVDRNS